MQMGHAKFSDHRTFGSGEEDLSQVFWLLFNVAQGNYTAVVGFEPLTSRSGV